MTVYATTQPSPLPHRIVRDTDVRATVIPNILLGATTCRRLIIANIGLGAVDAFFKVWDDTNPVIGTTIPDYVIPVPAGTTVDTDLFDGIAFANGFSYACTLLATQANTADPATTVTAEFCF